MNPIDTHVGIFLARKRKAAGLELREAAGLAHIAEDELHRVEAGQQRASAEMLLCFCRLYATTPADIYRDAPRFAAGDVRILHRV